MSTQSFNSIEREAIWSAHNKKCAYTGQSIMINGFHIDHIIPEHLSEKPDELSNIKSSLGLPANFDIFGYENLLPAVWRLICKKVRIILMRLMRIIF